MDTMKKFQEKLLLFFDKLGATSSTFLSETGGIFINAIRGLYLAFVPPYRWRNLLKQMEFIGAQSTFIVGLTGLFTGMILAFQSSHAFRLFRAETLIGPTVALSLTRELAPVFTALLVTARAGSAMAAEIGTMRISEQIDAIFTMGIDPVQYIITPRLVASILMLPLLNALFTFLGLIGGHIISVNVVGVTSFAYWDQIFYYVTAEDYFNGFLKAAVFGYVISAICTHMGYNASGGAEGVGRATTHAVVVASVSIFIFDYLLTALMY